MTCRTSRMIPGPSGFRSGGRDDPVQIELVAGFGRQMLQAGIKLAVYGLAKRISGGQRQATGLLPPVQNDCGQKLFWTRVKSLTRV